MEFEYINRNVFMSYIRITLEYMEKYIGTYVLYTYK